MLPAHTVITGLSGPNFDNKPGTIGINAAKNVQHWLHQGVTTMTQTGDTAIVNNLPTATVQYAPETKAFAPDLITNALGYAAADIQALDTNGDMALDRFELANVTNELNDYGFDYADRMVKVLDENNDGKVDVPESAAEILFSDNAGILGSQALHAFSQGNGLNQIQKQLLGDQAQWFSARFVSDLDGRITPMERAGAEFAYKNFTFMVSQTMQQLIQGLNLRQQYDTVRQARLEPTAPSATALPAQPKTLGISQTASLPIGNQLNQIA